jgi:hypothetical protein
MGACKYINDKSKSNVNNTLINKLICSGAIEAHFVHYNTRYASVEEAANQPDGLAVVGILFDVRF